MTNEERLIKLFNQITPKQRAILIYNYCWICGKSVKEEHICEPPSTLELMEAGVINVP